MRQIKPKPAAVTIHYPGGPLTCDGLVIGSLAVIECENGESMIVHVVTGRPLSVPWGTIAMAQHLNRECRWTWANSQPFGQKLEGRGATMLKKSIQDAISTFKPQEA
jgi:hypothetical protein